ncbi:MAG TPA: UDP-glucose/GDP-mannose dehydrogenase family protein [Trueperaceae bacterium]|nr:UDP-glucose/GDP-mannose dehydrogenase family protein [Trueperaceae bacterium]
MRVTIIGTGYVGLTTGTALAYLGNEVTFVDKKREVIEQLAAGIPTIHENGLAEIMAAGRQHATFRTDIPELSGEGVVLIAVGTPSREDGDADLSFVDVAATEVADKVQPGARLVVVNKSTVPVGSARHVEGIITRRLAARGVSAEVHVASNPEFLAEGRAVQDTLYPDRIVVGSDTQAARAMLRELYAPILEQTFDPPPGSPRPERLELPPFIGTTTTSAELTKYAANAFLATKISFINEFSVLAEKVGADIVEVARAIGLDSRIGGKFLNAGIGWGGSCFGKDTAAVMALGNSYDYQMPLVRAAVDVNKRQRMYVVEKLQQHLKVVRGTTIGLLGLAFKANTDDMRDAPALTLVRELSQRGAVLRVHDPIAMDNAKRHFPDLPVEYCASEVEMADGCDAIVVVTEWPQYRQVDFAALARVMRGDLLLDARNLLQPAAVTAAGLNYVGIGR